jgi:hypothetical protein
MPTAHRLRDAALNLILTLALAAVLGARPAHAGDADVPLAVSFGIDSARLAHKERLSLAHTEVLFEATPGWWLGPSVYGAAAGQRGGFFVGGLAVERPVAVAPGLLLVPAFTIGGGGGGGPAVGNGLMLRPSLSLQRGFGPWRAGLGVSELYFPGTTIRSPQIGLVAQWQGQFGAEPLARIGEVRSSGQRSGLGFDRLSLMSAAYALHGHPHASGVDLLGVQLDRFDDDAQGSGVDRYWGLEAAAATNRSSAGYMEMLGHGGLELALAPTLRLGARLALGFGGGGAVPSGGGSLAHVDATLRVDAAPGWHLGLALGRLAGAASALRGTRAELTLATDLEPARGPGVPGVSGGSGMVRRIEWAGAVEQIGAVRRTLGRSQSLQTLGLQINWWLGPGAYLTGQTHSALGGQAGAYAQGLLGAGIATPARGPGWQIGAELLAGAAGGAGVLSPAGAMAQAMVWLGVLPQADGAHARLALGMAASHQGPASPVLALSWVVPFAQLVR